MTGGAGKPSTLTFVIPAMPVPARTRGLSKTGKPCMVPDPTKPPRRKLIGYYTKGKTPNWTRMGEYHDWKDHVRAHLPPELGALSANTEAERTRVDVECHFESGTHNDPENIRKGLVDTLFPDGDKWAYGYHHHPLYDKENPRLVVTVTRWT